MKTKNQELVLLYDEHCPLCSAYSRLFVRLGLLTESGRLGYDAGIHDNSLHFDHDVARNKIALIDRQSQEVTYGISSLLRLLGTRWGWMQRVGRWPVIHQLLLILYSFITYNRKLIAPNLCHSFCSPDRNWSWRMAFLGFSAIMADWATGLYFGTWFNEHYRFVIPHFDVLLFTLQLVLLLGIFRLLKQANTYEYIGTIAWVSLIGALALLLIHVSFLLVKTLGMDVSLLAPVAFGMVYMLMFEIHRRRLKHYHWSVWLSWAWVIIRLLLYPLAFKL